LLNIEKLETTGHEVLKTIHPITNYEAAMEVVADVQW
jgi:hypothetical protein